MAAPEQNVEEALAAQPQAIRHPPTTRCLENTDAIIQQAMRDQ